MRSASFVIALLSAACSAPAATQDIRVEQRRAGGGLYDLGALPRAYGRVRWPEAPRIERDVRVSDRASADREAAVAGTRLVVTGDIDRVRIAADDVEVVNEGRIGQLLLDRGVSRVAIRG